MGRVGLSLVNNTRAELVILALDECLSSDGHFCFVATDEPVHYNMDPIPIFIGNVSRCKTSSDCTTSWSCIALRQDQQLVRITLMNALDDQQEQVVVWSGPRREIWEQGELLEIAPWRCPHPIS